MSENGRIPPLTEGYVVKGGRNQGGSQIKTRPPAPGPVNPSLKSPSEPLRASYLEMMRAHVDEGGQLSHRNGLDLLSEVERLRAAMAKTRANLLQLSSSNDDIYAAMARRLDTEKQPA